MKISLINQNLYSKFTSNRKEDCSSAKPAKKNKSNQIFSLLGSVAGILTATLLISRSQTQKMGKKIAWHSIKYEEKEIFAIGAGATIGGFLAGVLTDKQKNYKAKTKEGIYNFVANLTFPLLFIALFNRKIVDKMNIQMPKFKETNYIKETLNNISKGIPSAIATICGTLTGVTIGKPIANQINEKLFGEKSDRNIKAKDFLIHCDDLFTIMALADKTGSLKTFLGKIIPALSVLLGYETGTKKSSN